MKPEELKYSESHEWVHVARDEGGKIATIGITKFAVEQLSNLVYMELPQIGKQVRVQKEFGEVESVKAVSPLYSPVDGEVIAVNDAVPKNLEILDRDPYGEGWLIRVKISDDGGLSKLMDLAAYERQCSHEG